LPETTVIIVGYKQKELGEEITRRDKEVKIYGKYYPVEAKICEIEGLSHMQIKGLLNWLSELENKPKSISSSW
jgi:metallo-beta-lactamase family protein